jgi:hypothetical protein
VFAIVVNEMGREKVLETYTWRVRENQKHLTSREVGAVELGYCADV